MLSSEGVERSMRNAFPPEINENAHWGCTLQDPIVKVRCTYKGEDYSFSTDIKQKEDPATRRRMTPATAISNAVIYFKEIFQDLVEKELKVKEEAAKIEEEAAKLVESRKEEAAKLADKMEEESTTPPKKLSKPSLRAPTKK